MRDFILFHLIQLDLVLEGNFYLGEESNKKSVRKLFVTWCQPGSKILCLIKLPLRTIKWKWCTKKCFDQSKPTAIFFIFLKKDAPLSLLSIIITFPSSNVIRDVCMCVCVCVCVYLLICMHAWKKQASEHSIMAMRIIGLKISKIKILSHKR